MSVVTAGHPNGPCRKHLSPIKCPKSIDFEAELPRTPTGKLVKRHLRDKYWPKTAVRV